MTSIFVGAGRDAGVRPQDLVGAIANEARVSAREIGAIEIADRFSIVEVAEGVAQDVIRALRGTTVRGRKALRTSGRSMVILAIPSASS